MKKNYKGWFGDFSLDPEIDFYGNSYWESVAMKTYEPDTMAFLESSLDHQTDFIDVGAATGAISIIAAKLGSRVLAFEAVPKVFQIAISHLEYNLDALARIDLRNQAISNHDGKLFFGNLADRRVLAEISNDMDEQQSEFVQITSLANAIEEFHNKQSKLVIKIDIEGAEWRLLSDTPTLQTLQKNKALVLLAIHPGFYRPYRNLPLGLTIVSKKFWQFQNLVTAYFYFQKIMKFAKVYRTNREKVRSPKKCVLLMFGGYFEFILDFGSSE